MPTTPAPEHAPLERALLARLAELDAEIDADVATTRAARAVDGGEVHDRKDDAATQAEADVEAAEEARDRAERDRVRAALQRLAEGRYGRCLDCGEPIPPARLRAQPDSERCLACQIEAEARA
jgi:RNA polymerase-binding transcription factor DksA